jgi:hypothetical protein
VHAVRSLTLLVILAALVEACGGRSEVPGEPVPSDAAPSDDGAVDAAPEGLSCIGPPVMGCVWSPWVCPFGEQGLTCGQSFAAPSSCSFVHTLGGTTAYCCPCE